MQLQPFYFFSQFQNLRLKEVLLFLIGYSTSELSHLCQENDISVSEMINELLEIVNGYSFLTRKFLIETFSTLLSFIKQQKNYLCNYDGYRVTNLKIYETFKYLFRKALSVNRQKQNIHLFLQQQFRKYLMSHFEKENINNYHDCQYYQPIQLNQHTQQNHRNQLEIVDFSGVKFKQISQNVNQSILCEICYFPLRSKSSPFQEVYTLQQCQHQYHSQCLLQTIDQYMNTNSQILMNYPVEKQIPTDQNHLKTKLKCPDFEKCQVHLSMEQLHSFILSYNKCSKIQQKQQTTKINILLNRLYQLTFNDYLIGKGIKTFNLLKKQLQQLQQSDQHAQSYQKSFFQTQMLFYCPTTGCNAIYEVQKIINHSSFYKESVPDNFICVSCKFSYCIKCFSTLHPGMNCKEFVISQSHLPEDQELQKFINTLKRPYKRCPKCKFYVDNWRGCSTVKCRCGTEFCYKCGNIGCPHAKCIKETEKEQQSKQIKEKFTKKKKTSQSESD